MNAPATRLTLRPDFNGNAERRSFVRAITSAALAEMRGDDPASILKSTWPRDAMAETTLRAITTRGAVAPTSTTSAAVLGIETVRALLYLAPRSAALRLFNASLQVDMTGGVATVKIPNAAAVPPAVFVAEGAPAPVVRFALSDVVLGPVRKILLLACVSRELRDASAENAEAIIGRLLAASAEKGIDAVVFGTAAASAAQPAGLLNGVAPTTPTAGGGMNALSADLAKLAGAITNAGLDAEAMIIIAAPQQALTLKLLAGPKFDHPIFSTAALAAGTVVGIIPDAVAAATEGVPEIETRRDVAFHYDDATPQPISTGSPGVVASPVRSLFQEDVIALKCRSALAWAAAPGGVQVITGTTW